MARTSKETEMIDPDLYLLLSIACSAVISGGVCYSIGRMHESDEWQEHMKNLTAADPKK